MKFIIRLKNKYKLFNIFYIRFATIIVLLNYLNNQKIYNLKKYILFNLRVQIINSIKLLSYKDFITKLYIYNLDIKQNLAFNI